MKSKREVYNETLDKADELGKKVIGNGVKFLWKNITWIGAIFIIGLIAIFTFLVAAVPKNKDEI